MTLFPKDLLKQNEFWVFMFAVGVALLNWPILSLAVGRASIFGFPSILVYITAVWLLIILFAYFFDRGSSG